MDALSIDNLRILTHDVVIHIDGDRKWFTCPPKLVNELKSLRRKDLKQRKGELLEPTPIALPFVFPSNWRSRSGAKIRGTVQVEFLPLSVVHPNNSGFYPIIPSVSFSNCDPKILPDRWKKAFWDHMLKAIDAEIATIDLGCLENIIIHTKPVKVEITKSIDAEHAKPYRELVQAFADWQATHVARTGQSQLWRGRSALSE